jgi:hypothetical protein
MENFSVVTPTLRVPIKIYVIMGYIFLINEKRKRANDFLCTYYSKMNYKNKFVFGLQQIEFCIQNGMHKQETISAGGEKKAKKKEEIPKFTIHKLRRKKVE